MSEIKPIELTEKDKEFLESEQKMFDFICQAFQVPRELIQNPVPPFGYSTLVEAARWIDAEESINESRWKQLMLSAPDKGNESEDMPKLDHVV